MTLANLAPNQGELVWTPLNRSSRFALYRQIADRLREAIDAGATQLPTERQLAKGFSVARVTVRLALDLLMQDQLISRRPRFGTRVRAGSPDASKALAGGVEPHG